MPDISEVIPDFDEKTPVNTPEVNDSAIVSEDRYTEKGWGKILCFYAYMQSIFLQKLKLWPNK
jgi:hypothetical protein